MKPFVFAYNRFSKSARMLAKSLNADFSFPNKGNAPAPNQPVINWGSSFQAPWMWRAGRILNNPNAVALAVNKLKTFKKLKVAQCPIPEFTTDHNEGYRWIREGHVIYARKTLTGRKGEGCVVYDLKKNLMPRGIEDLEDVKLFTKRFDAHWEFKVHVVNGKVDHVIRVAKDEDFKQDPYIRNHNNGWTFYDEERALHPDILKACISAVGALGLDFGIVDVGVGKAAGQMCIYEINTAPGGEQGDVDLYVKAFKREYGIVKGK